MSIAEMADFAVSVLAVFAGAIAFDMIGKYRIQLAYSSATPTPVPNRPKALTRPAIRHVLLFIVVCIGVYIYRSRSAEPSGGAIAGLVLFVGYGVMLFRDALREIRTKP